MRPRSDVGGVLSSLVSPVTRTTPLAIDTSWTFTAGPDGAVSTNDALGITVTIPAGALTTVHEITVTGFAGSALAYGFAPHLRFGQPVVLTQSLQGTSASVLSLLSGAHFTADTLRFSNGLAIVDELAPATISVLTQSVSFSIGHFSGWIIATDDAGDSGGGSD